MSTPDYNYLAQKYDIRLDEVERRLINSRQISSFRLQSDSSRIEIWCGTAQWVLRKGLLASQSDYFKIACIVYKAASMFGRIDFPAAEEEHVGVMVNYLAQHRYAGRRLHSPQGMVSNPGDSIDKDDDMPSEETDATSEEETDIAIEFRSDDDNLLCFFPEFVNGYVYQGDTAVKIAKLITHHKEFHTKHTGFEMHGSRGYRCQPDLLPRDIQLELFPFLWEIKSREDAQCTDPVFHAEMYKLSIKYMMPGLQSAVASAFRASAMPWIHMASKADDSFVKALTILFLGRGGLVTQVTDLKMYKAVLGILGVNWGWMRHEESLMAFMKADELVHFLEHVQKEAASARNLWVKRSSKKPLPSLWGDESS